MPDIDIKVDEALVAKLQRFFCLEEADLEFIRQVGEVVLPSQEQFLDDLYSHILSFPEMSDVYKDDKSRQRARAGQGKHLARLLLGIVGEEYVREGLRIGSHHQELGINPFWYLSGYARYVSNLYQMFWSKGVNFDKGQIVGICQALVKIILLDIALAWEAYYQKGEQKLRDAYKTLAIDHNFALGMIEQRDREIKELLERLQHSPPG